VRARALAISGALVVLAAAVWGFVVEPNRLVMHEVRLALPRWPAALDGLRVAVVADIHAGAPWIDDAKVRRVVAEVNQAHPDLVVLLGDFVTRGVVGGHPVAPERTAEALAGLHTPLGVIAILGNHDWWYDGTRVRRALEDSGIRVLENAALRLEWKGAPVWLLGLADLWTRKPDVVGPLRDIPEDEPIIVLTHNPDVFPRVPPRVALTLAGHTHGGQVVLPVFGRLLVPSRFGQRYAIGLVEEGGRRLFVTPGIGTSIVPVRFGVPPEISLLTLARAER
jgi:uncharacterized protein